MTEIPEEAVEAAWKGYCKRSGKARDRMRDALLAALPFLKDGWRTMESCPCKLNACYLGIDQRDMFIFYASRQADGEMRYYLDEPDGFYRRTPKLWYPLPRPPLPALPQERADGN